MKRKIGIDLTYIKDSEVSGIKKYGEEMVEGLSKASNEYEIVLFVYEHLKSDFQKKFPDCKIVTVKFLFRNIKYIRRINYWNVSKLPKKIMINREKCDLVIYPFTEKLTPIIKKQKKIVAILDLIPLDIIEDKDSTKAKKIKKQYIKIMNKCQYITTLSEYSKKRFYEINPKYNGEIIVIPSSVIKPKLFKTKVKDEVISKGKYIFSINSFYKHKNQITLVKAFNNIKDQIQHNLILVRKTRN